MSTYRPHASLEAPTSHRTTIDNLFSSHQDWHACDECGQVQHSVPLARNQLLVCYRCETPLQFGRGAWREICAASVVTGVILFIISNCFVFLGLEVGTFYHEANLLSGVWALFASGYWALGILVLVTIFLFPLLELLALTYLVLPCYFDKHLPGQRTIFRWLQKAAPWSMLEIFLLGVLVTSVKLGDMATIVLGVSIVSFFGLVAVLGATYWYINKQDLWAWLYPNNCFVSKANEKLYDCHVCNALVGETVIDRIGQCPRCFDTLHRRKPESLQRTAAYTIAAAALYWPANMLPIMTVNSLTGDQTDTIFTGIVTLAAHGLWGIAAIVFLASIVVPVAKIIVLAYLVWSVYRRHQWGMRHRTWLYRVTEWVGRWSMVDVFVVTLLAGLVQFGYLGAIEPGPALLPFAAVVVLTMVAAHSFDPRLIWDAAGSQEKAFALPSVNKPQ